MRRSKERELGSRNRGRGDLDWYKRDNGRSNGGVKSRRNYETGRGLRVMYL